MAGRAVLGPHTTQLHDRAAGHGKVGNPDVVVTIHNHCPGTGKAATFEWRSGILRTVRSQQRDATTVAGAALLLRHRLCQVIRGRCDSLGLQAYSHVDKVSHALRSSAKPVSDPD